MNQASVVPIQVGSLRRLTRALPYFSDWSGSQLKSIETACRAVMVTTPTMLLQLNGLEPFAYFLLRGDVQLQDGAGTIRTLRAGETDAGFPLTRQKDRPLQLTALPGAELLRIETSKLRSHQVRRKPARYCIPDDAPDAPWRGHPLVVELIHQAETGSLALPAIPGIALRVQRALAKDATRTDEIVAIISADPAITARLLKVANSAFFGMHTQCETVKAALLRLGMEKSRNLVTSLLLRDLFSSRHAALKKLMLQRWRHAIDIAALCAVLARLTPGLQPERAMLVGLLHEIGALPIIRLAESHPDLLADSATLLDILTHLTPELSAMALEGWGFEPEFITAAQHQHQWFRDHEGTADYTDVLQIAHLHGLVHQRAELQLPRIDEIPAFHKLALGQLTPHLSLQVLEEARQQIDELKSLLA